VPSGQDEIWVQQLEMQWVDADRMAVDKCSANSMRIDDHSHSVLTNIMQDITDGPLSNNNGH